MLRSWSCSFSRAITLGFGRRLDEFFSQTMETPRLTFTIRRDQAEFRRIPLLNVGTHGARFVKSLQLFNAAGFQLEKGMSPEEAGGFVETVLEWSRKTDGPDALELPTGAGFCLLTDGMVQELRQAGVAEQLGKPLTPDVPDITVSTASFNRLLSGYRSQLSNLRVGNNFDHELLQRVTENVVEQFRTEDESMVPLHSESYFDDFTYHHSVNVCLITAYLARRLTGDTELLRRIANAALLHDIGKSKIPVEVLYKTGRLTAGERECLEEHPVIGAELLLSMPQIDDLAVAVAFGHHMHDAAGSYPHTKRPLQCDWVTELVGVVDIYEALTAHRPYKAGLSSETAYKVMLDMPGLKKRLHFVKLLYNCLGPYPPGALLQLDSGAWAVSLQHNALAPYSPRIRVLTDEKRAPLATPYVIDLDAPTPPDSEASLPRIVRQVVVQGPAKDSLQAEPIPEPSEILGRPLHDDKALMLREG